MSYYKSIICTLAQNRPLTTEKNVVTVQRSNRAGQAFIFKETFVITLKHRRW